MGVKVRVPPAGFEPAISTLKGWRPGPLDDGGEAGERIPIAEAVVSLRDPPRVLSPAILGEGFSRFEYTGDEGDPGSVRVNSEENRTACKPHSVTDRAAGGDHLSCPTSYLGDPCTLPGTRRAASTSLLGLAPGRV